MLQIDRMYGCWGTAADGLPDNNRKSLFKDLRTKRKELRVCAARQDSRDQARHVFVQRTEVDIRDHAGWEDFLRPNMLLVLDLSRVFLS